MAALQRLGADMSAPTSPPVRYPAVDALPVPAGHYSPVAVGGGLVAVSGQLPVDATGRPRPDLSFEAQATLVLDNVQAALAAAGCDWQHVLKVTVYVAGIKHWPAFDALYRARLGSAKPARAVVPVVELHHGVLIEIEALAVQDRP